MSSVALQWEQVAIIMIGLVLGFYFNNRSIAHLDKRIDDLRVEVNHRFDDMKEWIKSEFRRLDERVDNLADKIDKLEVRTEHPVIKAG